MASSIQCLIHVMYWRSEGIEPRKIHNGCSQLIYFHETEEETRSKISRALVSAMNTKIHTALHKDSHIDITDCARSKNICNRTYPNVFEKLDARFHAEA